jgi:uncharacterized tellurite resistance protein B-like protein
MIARLKRLFQDAVDQAAAGDNPEQAVRRAAAALMVEMIRADSEVTEGERAHVTNALETEFGLPPDEARALLVAADDDADAATSLYEFTSVLNQCFSHEQKVRLVDQLWGVAYADGSLDKHEAHLVRKVADLLHLRHREYIGGKLRAGG